MSLPNNMVSLFIKQIVEHTRIRKTSLLLFLLFYTTTTIATNNNNNNNNKMGCASSIEIHTGQIPEGFTPKSYPIYGPKEIMRKKKHGTSETPVQLDLRWNCNRNDADRICNFNRHGAEWRGAFAKNSDFCQEFQRCKQQNTTMKFYDSNTGTILFEAPRGQGRSHDTFWKESKRHGWPSFRDEEVHWDNVRCLTTDEVVSLAGTHLGHNLPDRSGNRFCINLLSVCGTSTRPTTTTEAQNGPTTSE